MRSTNRLPATLCVPNDCRRHSTARRSARSAEVFVGSTPRTRTNVHNAASTARMCRHVPLVLLDRHSLPAASNSVTLPHGCDEVLELAPRAGALSQLVPQPE